MILIQLFSSSSLLKLLTLCFYFWRPKPGETLRSRDALARLHKQQGCCSSERPGCLKRVFCCVFPVLEPRFCRRLIRAKVRPWFLAVDASFLSRRCGAEGEGLEKPENSQKGPKERVSVRRRRQRLAGGELLGPRPLPRWRTGFHLLRRLRAGASA